MTRMLALLILGLISFSLSAQDRPERREITQEEIQNLQQQLSAIAALQGKTPEELQKLFKLFENGQFGNLGDLKKNLPNGIPKLPKIQPPAAPPIPEPAFPNVPRPPVPNQLQPVEPALPGGQWKPNAFNPEAFNQPPLDPKLNQHPGVAEMAKFWEKNFGPLEKTPAVRDALIELFEMSKDQKLFDGEWKNFMDEFNKGQGGNDEFANWLKEMNLNGGKWDMPDWGKGWDMNWGGGWGGGNWGGGGGGNWGGGWGGGNWGGGGFGGMSVGGGGGSWLPVIILVAIIVIGLLAWKFWPMIQNRESSAAQAVRSLGRWPIDPRTINSREELVRAFEYLSVLLCGDAARVWNHLTIARALRTQIPSSELVADELAKLYELARYTPAGEPLSPASLADARRCLCTLAGVTP